VEYVEPPPPWEVCRQGILNSRAARMPEHTFKTPVPVVAHVVREQDGKEQFQTVALGWTGRNVYVRITDPRYRLSATWLDATDIRRP
jgi:hypothetical protein